MKRTLSVILALCLALSCLIFAGCSKEQSNNWPVTVGGVTIDKEPQNIVVLNDCFADIISYIGYDIKMVGRSDECDQDFLHIVPSVGTAVAPDTAKITAAQADLVIADSTLSADAKAAIEKGGAKVATFEVPATEEALKQLYTDLGSALGGSTDGSKKGSDGYDGLIEMLGNMNTAASNIVCTVAYLYLDENGQLCTFTDGTLAYKFFNYNGNTNIFPNQTDPAVNPEKLRISSPNYIFYDTEETLTALQTNEEYARVHALVNNATLMIPRKAFSRYGTSAEKAIYDILSFIEKDRKATPDSAAPAATAQAETSAQSETAAQEEATAAPAAEATQAPAQDEEVISYSVQNQ